MSKLNEISEFINNTMPELIKISILIFVIILVYALLSAALYISIKIICDRDNKKRGALNGVKQIYFNFVVVPYFKKQLQNLLILQPQRQQLRFNKFWFRFDKNEVFIKIKPKNAITIKFLEQNNYENLKLLHKLILNKYSKYEFSSFIVDNEYHLHGFSNKKT